MDDFNVSDKAVKEFFEGIELISLDIKKHKVVLYSTSYEHPINLIDVIIGGILISSENKNNTYLNEINSQFKLINELGKEEKNIPEKIAIFIGKPCALM